MAVTLWPRRSGAGHVRPPARIRAADGDYRPTHACPHHVDAPAGVLPEPAPARRLRARSGRPPSVPATRRPAAKKKQSPGLFGRRQRRAGTCSPAAPAASPARSPDRRRPSRSRPSTAATGSASPSSAWRSCWAPRRGATASARSAPGWPTPSAGSSARCVMVLPVVLFFAALRLLRRGPRPEARGRLAIGWLCTDRRRCSASPRSSGRRPIPDAGVPGSGGLLGWAVGTPLVAGVGADRHRRPAGACWPSSACWSPPPRRCTRSPSGCASSPTGCWAATTTTSTTTRTTRTRPTTRRSRAAGPPRSPEVALGGPAHHRPDRPRRPRRRRRRRPSPPSRSTPTSVPRPAAGRRPDRRRPRTCRRSTSRSSCTIQPVEGNYVLPSLTVLRPGHAAARPVQGQRRRHRGDHRRPRAVQHRRRRHRLHPRPDGHPLRGRARPGGQGREDHRADPEPGLRGRQRQHPHPGADPRQVRGRHRGAQHRPRDGQPRRRPALAARPSRTRTRCWSASARTSRAASSARTWRRCRTCWSPVPPVPVSPAASTRC